MYYDLGKTTCGPKARDPKLGTTIEKIGILDQFLTKLNVKHLHVSV